MNIPGLEDFKGSDGLLTLWKKRNSVGIRRGTNESQKLPADFHEQVVAFKKVKAKLLYLSLGCFKGGGGLS